MPSSSQEGLSYCKEQFEVVTKVDIVEYRVKVLRHKCKEQIWAYSRIEIASVEAVDSEIILEIW